MHFNLEHLTTFRASFQIMQSFGESMLYICHELSGNAVFWRIKVLIYFIYSLSIDIKLRDVTSTLLRTSASGQISGR